MKEIHAGMWDWWLGGFGDVLLPVLMGHHYTYLFYSAICVYLLFSTSSVRGQAKA